MFTGKMNAVTGYLSKVSTTGNATESTEETKKAASDNEEEKQEKEAQESASGEEEKEEKDSKKRKTVHSINFTLKDQYGNTHTLSDYKGKTVFLNFWATWCGPCRNEMPEIQKLYEEYQAKEDQDVVILGIAAPDLGGEASEEEIKAFLEENGYTYPVVMDTTGEIFTSYGISAFPTTFMIDKDSNVYGYVSGQLSEDVMRNIIEQTQNQK